MNTLEHAVFNLDKKKKNINIDNMISHNKVNVYASIYKKENNIKIVYKENSKGFDINILKDLHKFKYHGKGIQIIKFLSEGVFFNKKGNEVKIFLKERK